MHSCACLNILLCHRAVGFLPGKPKDIREHVRSVYGIEWTAKQASSFKALAEKATSEPTDGHAALLRDFVGECMARPFEQRSMTGSLP